MDLDLAVQPSSNSYLTGGVDVHGHLVLKQWLTSNIFIW